MASRFNLLTSLQISKKSEAQGLFEFNPFKYGLNDNNLITLSTILLNTLSFNRLSTVWGVDISNMRNSAKSLLTYGYESRSSNDWSFKYRHSLSRSVMFNLAVIKGLSALYTGSGQFENRNYEISKFIAEPSATYIRGTNFRLTGAYKFGEKANASAFGGEKSIANSLTLETKYNMLQSASLTGKFTYENLNYKAANTGQTTVSYIMLDGLMPGKNFLWGLMLTKRLMNNLELNFQYDGRKAGSTGTVHTGRASVTAIF